ncbi:hypothetical protein DMENIID0001_013080 [Sergentomyia squamirostris]
MAKNSNKAREQSVNIVHLCWHCVFTQLMCSTGAPPSVLGMLKRLGGGEICQRDEFLNLRRLTAGLGLGLGLGLG